MKSLLWVILLTVEVTVNCHIIVETKLSDFTGEPHYSEDTSLADTEEPQWSDLTAAQPQYYEDRSLSDSGPSMGPSSSIESEQELGYAPEPFRAKQTLSKEEGRIHGGEEACPLEDDFFMYSGQCFKMFNDHTRNWFEAKETCASHSLVLAHPFDALGLRSFMVQKIGWWSYSWMNARGNGRAITWLDGKASTWLDYINPINPLWWPREPSNVSSEFCMVLAANDDNWKKLPDQTYFVKDCKTATWFTLCELPMA